MDEFGLHSSGNIIPPRFLSREINGEKGFFEKSANERIQKMS